MTAISPSSSFSSSLMAVATKESSSSLPPRPSPSSSSSKYPSRRHINKLSNADLDRKIKSLGRSGKTDEALQIYSSIDRPTIRILNGVIDACARARPTRLNKAFEIFDNAALQTKNKIILKPNVFTFGSLMNACNRARDGKKSHQAITNNGKELRC